MKNLQRVRTRRQLLRVTAVGAASFPFLALARKSASAQTMPAEHKRRHGTARGTQDSTARHGNQLLFEGY